MYLQQSLAVNGKLMGGHTLVGSYKRECRHGGMRLRGGAARRGFSREWAGRPRLQSYLSLPAMPMEPVHACTAPLISTFDEIVHIWAIDL